MSALPEERVSLEDYFKLDETSDSKHEYYQGVVYALTGASKNHNLITLDVGSSLLTQLAGKPCQPYPSDFRLKIEAVNLYTYPDLSVICGDTQLVDGRRDTFVNPTVLIKVLSESMGTYDRGNKAEFYRTIPSLQEYLLLAQDRPHVERYRRQGRDWLLTEYSTLEDVVTLDSINCILPLAVIYRRVSFEDSPGARTADPRES
ncbi:MAG: Uma2 family endonuclease [Armatimonadota bacterium]